MIQGRRFQVIGVTALEKSGFILSLSAYENLVYIPLANWQQLYGGRTLSEMDVSVKNLQQLNYAMVKTKQLLNQRHNTRDRVGVNIKIHIYGHFLVHKYGKDKSTNMEKLTPQLWEDKVHNYGNQNSTLLVTSPLFASWDLSFCRSLRR